MSAASDVRPVREGGEPARQERSRAAGSEAAVRYRLRGRLSELDPAELDALIARAPRRSARGEAHGIYEGTGAARAGSADGVTAASMDPAAVVAGIVADVRTRGDEALREMAERFDGVALDAIEVPRTAWEAALEALDPDLRSALERAAANIRRFHEAQLPDEVRVEVEPGVVVTRAWTPLARVGVYAPGGTAAYPSSVLMGVVPARAAGVDEVVVCSPPGTDGRPPSAVLAACAIAGADRVFAIGGAGAVAAMVWGTESVPPVDAVVGPGNRWVTEAKRQVAGDVVIDSPAGPSEVLVLADETAEPELVAVELLAQAEHDPDAACVLVSTSAPLADRVAEEVEARVPIASRSATMRAALEEFGALLVVDSLDEAIALTERFAPEHLAIMTRDAAALARRIRNAGTTFVGPAASVAFGDYATGANHVLPTAGRARSFSGLSTYHFLRSYTIQEIDARGASSLADDVVRMAEAEGLPAHADAARARAGGAR
jgi:histidinol dehydrogenase